MVKDYSKIPEHCREGMRLYVEKGHPVGSFLRAILENNLVQAFGRADEINTEHIRNYADFLYNDAPEPRWGSPAKVAAWLEKFAAERRAKETP